MFIIYFINIKRDLILFNEIKRFLFEINVFYLLLYSNKLNFTRFFVLKTFNRKIYVLFIFISTRKLTILYINNNEYIKFLC